MMVGGVCWCRQARCREFVSVKLGLFERHQWLGPSTMVIGHGDVFWHFKLAFHCVLKPSCECWELILLKLIPSKCSCNVCSTYGFHCDMYSLLKSGVRLDYCNVWSVFCTCKGVFPLQLLVKGVFIAHLLYLMYYWGMGIYLFSLHLLCLCIIVYVIETCLSSHLVCEMVVACCHKPLGCNGSVVSLQLV